MSDLEKRIDIFSNMTKSFSCNKVHDLIVSYKIDKYDLENLELTAKLYLSKSLNKEHFNLDEFNLLEYYEKNYKNIKNITPNGLVVPKNHSILEYNLLNQAFYRIIQKLNIDSYITSWHIPLNLRIKIGYQVEENMARAHPTEYVHSDSWAGESAESVTVMIPIFGDIENNYVQFYSPPEDFEEEWLGPRPSYKNGEDVARKYKKIDFISPRGTLTISDFSTLHCSHRNENAKIRVSIDTTFALKRNSEKEVIHPWRENERATIEVVNNIGKQYLFVFPDSIEQQVDSRGGFKHPTNLQVRKLYE